MSSDTPAPGRRMTMAEIEAAYPGEWVLIADPETTEQLEVLSGRVIDHDAGRDEVGRKLVALRLRSSAVLLMPSDGEPDEEIGYLL